MNSGGYDNSEVVRTVLVVGPFSACGGMGAVCRQMQSGELAHRWRVIPLDNTKSTSTDRSLFTAVTTHLVLLLRLIGAIARHRPTLVHIHTCSYQTFYRSMPDILIGWAFLRPVVLHIHGGHFHRFVGELVGLRKKLVLLHLRMCRRALVLGEVWKERLEAVLPRERVRVVPNAVAIPERSRTTRRHKPLRVIYIGDLSADKAPEDLIEAVARLSPGLRRRVCVELIGGGTPQRSVLLEHLIDSRGLRSNVRLLGQVAPDQVAGHLRLADVHVLPSHGEGLPLALLEAMAWGLPSIVSGVGAIPEVVTDGVEAFITEPGNIEVLAQRLTRLLSDAGLRAVMGRSARERVCEAFALPQFHAALHRVWSEIATGGATLPTPDPPDRISVSFR